MYYKKRRERIPSELEEKERHNREVARVANYP
jgi:hypothetical protein